MHEYKRMINEAKNSIVDGLYIGLSIFMIPVIIVQLIRLFNHEFTMNIILVPLTVVVIPLVFLYRKKIDLSKRVWLLVILFELIGISGMISYGALSMTLMIMLLSSIIVALFIENRGAYYIYALNLLIVSVHAVWNIVAPRASVFDVEAYYYSSGNWYNQIVGFGALALMGIIAIRRMRHIMNTRMNDVIESEIRYKELAEDLEVKVEERTQNLKETMDELVDKERLVSLGSLVAGVAHEINTPIGVSVSAVTFLEEKNRIAYDRLVSGAFSKEDLVTYMKTVDEGVEIINKNITRAAELVKSFKEISVDQSNEIRTSVVLKEYIESVLITLKHEYKNTSHKIEVECPSELTVFGYKGAYAQIFTNLIMNSLIHGLRETENGLIRIRVEDKLDHFVIYYSDNGRGITDAHIKKIFDPFFTTNRKEGGSGLGMNVVYNLVTAKLNGKIRCESVLGQGAQFIMTLPKEQKGAQANG